MTIQNLSKVLNLNEIVAAKKESDIQGCYSSDLLSWVLAHGQEDQLWLTIMGNSNVVAVAKLVDFAAVILCENAPLDDQAKEQAETNGIGIYRTPLPIYELTLQIGELLPQ